jgi:hypothetical protein
MALRQATIQAFSKGTHNLVDSELIPQDAASESRNWLTRDGKIELMYGRQAFGDEGAAGKIYAEHTGSRVDGTEVRFRKAGTKIQYYDVTTEDWEDTLTGLSLGDVTFTNYSSLAGAFVYVTSPEIGIYKIPTANPASAVNMYDATKNFKGYAFINEGRMILWGRDRDKTGLYGSWIDAQDGDVYTTVSAEILGSGDGVDKTFSGTLAFKAGGATRTCHGVVITVTGGEVVTDDFNGNLIGNNGAVGTINYATGAWSILFDTAPANASNNITAGYQWENSNAKGVTDFSKSTPRQPGQGFVVRQDQGGDEIKVVIPHDGSYFSMKARSVYQFTLDAADTNPKNELIRTDVGVETLRGAVATNIGIIFLNTGNPSKPMMNVLKRDPLGDNFTTAPMFAHFKFENYQYDDVSLFSWDRYVLTACKDNSPENNRILMCNILDQTVDVTDYGARAFARFGGLVHAGDPVSLTTYELFTGFDDMGTVLTNEWESKDEKYSSQALKKVKRLRFRGLIDSNQIVEVYWSQDESEYQLIGTIRGDQDYVDYQSSTAVGTSLIGNQVVGGEGKVNVYTFYMELKMRTPKFRKRKIKFVATGLGYVAIQEITDFDIWRFEERIPKQYRQKQNVSIDGTQDDL